MNILVMVFSFIAALALSTAVFWQTLSSVSQETSSFRGYMAANREAENSLQRRLFSKLPDAANSTSASTQDSTSTPKATTTFRSHRLKCPPHPYARLQLAALWETDSHPFVEKAFKQLLNELYGHTPWFKQARDSHTLDDLLQAMIRFGKAEKGDFALHELISSLHDDAQAGLLCHMLQGTHTYRIEDKTGYPPLLDFVSFTSGTIKQTCHFCFASLPLLRALFDKDTVAQILAIEQKKWDKDHKKHTCTKDELLSLLRSRSPGLTEPATVTTYFHFGKQAAPRQKVLGADSSTGIHSERDLKSRI